MTTDNTKEKEVNPLHKLAERIRKYTDPMELDTKVTITEGKYTGKSGVIKGYRGKDAYRVNVANVGVRNFNRKYLKLREEVSDT